ELARTAYHNTVTVDGRDQMDQAGRFLWLPWAEARVLSSKTRVLSSKTRALNAESATTASYWEGEHDGYLRSKSRVRHRRAIINGGDWWVVADSLSSADEQEYRCQWLLPDVEFEFDETSGCVGLETEFGRYCVRVLSLTGAGIASLIRADRNSARGWFAPGYCQLDAALSLALKVRAASCLLISFFGPGLVTIDANGARVKIGSESLTLDVGASVETAGSLLNDISLNGTRVIW